MDIVVQLAEMMVKEYEQKGKRLSFELARLTVQAKTCDGMVRAMMRDPEMSAEKGWARNLQQRNSAAMGSGRASV